MLEVLGEDQYLSGAVLMSGYPLVIFDNLNSRLDSPSLALAITARTWSDQVLGESRVVSVSQEATWAVTGNNVRVHEGFT